MNVRSYLHCAQITNLTTSQEIRSVFPVDFQRSIEKDNAHLYARQAVRQHAI